MKTFQVKVLAQNNEETVISLLTELANKGIVEFHEGTESAENKSVPVSEDQAQEIIEESEIGPYYSEKDAKDILNI